MEKTLFLLPYYLSLAISLGVLYHAWRNRHMRGASAYAWYVAGQTLWIVGYILELVHSALDGKIFWDQTQWVAGLIITVVFPVFSVQYTETKIRWPRLLVGLLLIAPLGFLALLLTDNQHHLLYPNPFLDHTHIFADLKYDFTWAVYAYAIYGYLATFTGLGILIRRFIRPHRLYRRQIITVAIGFFIPIFFTMLTTAGIEFMPFRDVSPFTFTIGNSIVAWGLFRYRLFAIAPIARDFVFDNMEDIVVVLDAQDRIVDLNQSALQELKLTPSQAIGKPAAPIFSNWPEVLEIFRQPDNVNTEVILKRDENYYHFDVKSTLLHDRHGEYQGRIFVARDITDHAALQWDLRKLNEELEERVAQRTNELAEAYDTTLEGWARALEMRDKETKDHSQRVTDLTIKLAQAMGIKGDDLIQIRRGSILHDIGKMGIPDEILRKRGKLTISERKVIEQHPIYSYELLSHIPFLEKALEVPYCHHEHWGGGGYPRGLKGEEIPLAARIFSVVDVWDVITSDRPYSEAWPKGKAIQYLKEESGKYFDPECVSVFLDLVEQGKI